MAVVPNLETASELLCEMELVFDHCNMLAVMVCCSIRCTSGYQGNLCDQRELTNEEAVPCILVSYSSLSLSLSLCSLQRCVMVGVVMGRVQTLVSAGEYI